jgi:hypothetical protein
VSFDGRSVTYGVGELDVLVPAYAATIHKSQGSEYLAVIIPVLTQHYAMLQRNLLYTGVTRGKGLVVLVGQKKAVAIAWGTSFAGMHALELAVSDNRLAAAVAQAPLTDGLAAAMMSKPKMGPDSSDWPCSTASAPCLAGSQSTSLVTEGPGTCPSAPRRTARLGRSS